MLDLRKKLSTYLPSISSTTLARIEPEQDESTGQHDNKSTVAWTAGSKALRNVDPGRVWCVVLLTAGGDQAQDAQVLDAAEEHRASKELQGRVVGYLIWHEAGEEKHQAERALQLTAVVILDVLVRWILELVLDIAVIADLVLRMSKVSHLECDLEAEARLLSSRSWRAVWLAGIKALRQRQAMLEVRLTFHEA
ncbi:hypothetical protein LTR56_010033 [Elasticomyces elasticus]|nr:hypothetical protein LTR56_010033 [Elasticomyces elasticus]KAK3665029.1 hypothetical protein LTR22_004083 [Elasticomyces elasticus]KAK4931595.1 hypothetical protein LTR49_001985 [Elasticomyces elasticus]KAK5766754.1 hypothetical protein LTS12_003105 [Elasticomyces elasticus]